MTVGREHSEKRQFIRMHIDTEIDFEINNQESLHGSGKVENLSASGVSFVTASSLEIGDILDFNIEPGNVKTRALCGTAVVRRTEVIEDGILSVGAEFTQLT